MTSGRHGKAQRGDGTSTCYAWSSEVPTSKEKSSYINGCASL
jgi:hypothetical protein